MSLAIPLTGSAPALVSEVGGKAASLMRLAAEGFAVPAGTVLSTSFFAPWFDRVRASAPWRALAGSEPAEWARLGGEVRAFAGDLLWTPLQRQALESVRTQVAAQGGPALLAVRSSSPEEDLVAASFAGGYETVLGVLPDRLEQAVRRCFAASLDARVLLYKRQHRLDPFAPSLAVIVQGQLDAEVAGVGFSINPLSNDYDEAVIESNWGLGESVVAGLATPDRFVLDKVSGQVMERSLGAKEATVRLQVTGGTTRTPGERSGEISLDEPRLGELTAALCRVETLYGRPMDVEWAYAAGRLYLLQARPITAFVPLPPEMLTRPGERRRLYADAALSKGMTTNRAISPLGLELLEGLFRAILESWVGALRPRAPAEALFFFAGGRMYVNYSNLLWLGSPKLLARSTRPTDALMAEILGSIDSRRYRAPRRPRQMGLQLLWLLPRLLWSLRGLSWSLLRATVSPRRARAAFEHRIATFEAELRRASLDQSVSLEELRHVYAGRMARELFGLLGAMLVLGMASPSLAARRDSEESAALAARLDRGVEGDVVVEMGIELFRLARQLGRSELEDPARLAARLEQRALAPELLAAWDAFLERFGCRGPGEMDPASPRYGDSSELAVAQMTAMAIEDGAYDPETAHRRQIDERQRAFGELMRRSGPLRRLALRRLHRFHDLFAGARDTPKHLIVQLTWAVRRRALAHGAELARQGRLDAPEQVFDLAFSDLEAAARDPSLDLRAIGGERRLFFDALERQVRRFPAVIDSRGRILRPPPAPETPGKLRGTGVSPGVARGPVKVLDWPGEKRVEKGDVLVAYTTDPGWTPLFVNAAAILLEVGGVMQHGAVVAREYGKPCVVGIDRVASRLRDGQQVEVDGATGICRVSPSASGGDRR